MSHTEKLKPFHTNDKGTAVLEALIGVGEVLDDLAKQASGLQPSQPAHDALTILEGHLHEEYGLRFSGGHWMASNSNRVKEGDFKGILEIIQNPDKFIAGVNALRNGREDDKEMPDWQVKNARQVSILLQRATFSIAKIFEEKGLTSKQIG